MSRLSSLVRPAAQCLASLILFAPPAAGQDDFSELRQRARDGSKWTRQRAVEELAALDRLEAWELVVAALEDQKGEVADTAQLVLAALDGPEELKLLLGKQGLRARDAWVRLRVAEVLGRLEVPVSTEVLERALGDDDEHVRRAGAWSVQRLAAAGRLQGDGKFERALARRFQREREPGVRARLLAALVQAAPDLGRAALEEAVRARESELRAMACRVLALGAGEAIAARELGRLAGDSQRAVRSAALDALAALRTRAALEVLVERLVAEDDEPLAARLVRTLQALSGLKHRADPRPWRDWLRALPEDWRAERGPEALEPEPPDRNASQSVSFAGMPILSKRIAFLIDLSGSMWTPDATGRTPKDVVAEELARALSSLAPDTLFQLVPYTEHPRPWKKEAVPATPGNVRAAIRFFEDLNDRGTGNFWDAAMFALEDETVDTLCVLTDGAPTGGRRHRLELIVPLFEELDETRSVAVDSLLVDATRKLRNAWSDLARRTGGRSMAVDLSGP